MPSIGGIINGANAMRDISFADLSLADVERVFGPKVEGSRILDEIYQNDDNLDFFILMGSIAGPLGNFHQTAYSAATEYMAGLIHQRRSLGQVGSIIHPTQIRGVGYLATVDTKLQDVVADAFGPLILSERDLLELFAEAIMAGRPDSDHTPGIIAGWHLTDPVEYPNVNWYNNPKAWSFIKNFRQSEAAQDVVEEVPINEQLSSAESLAAATQVVADAFRAKLRRKLHLPGDSALPGTTLLTEVGVDSLIAVDLRLWFVKELGIDVPVLQLLGGSSIDMLASGSVDKLDPMLVPLAKSACLPN